MCETFKQIEQVSFRRNQYQKLIVQRFELN